MAKNLGKRKGNRPLGTAKLALKVMFRKYQRRGTAVRTMVSILGEVTLLKQRRHLLLRERFAGPNSRVASHEAHDVV